MGGAAVFVTRNGQRMTAWMAYQFDRLAAAFFLRFGLVLLVMSAIRTYQEQVDIFLSRYVTAGQVNGRRVYDTRVWNGTRYYRISAAGTVAVPGTSNHEIQGDTAAADFGDSGKDAGVAVAGTERANWLKANAPAYDYLPEGYGFGEAWHYKALNIYATPPAGGGGSTPETQESGNMQSVRINGKEYGLDVEFITHYGNPAQAKITREVTSATDELHDLNAAFGKDALNQWGLLLDGMGIPRDALNAQGLVKNPQANNNKGAYEANGTWSRRREILANLARLDAKVSALK